MSLLVTGSIGIDTVETPFGRREAVLGGSAIYFAYAASFFAPVRLVGVVGSDAPRNFFDIFKGRNVDTSGLEVRAGSKTFRWHGSYMRDMNEAQTIEVDLNVLAERAPLIPQNFRDSKFVFLANTHPALQLKTLGDFPTAQLIVADTMNLWIQTERHELSRLLGKIHGLVLNDGEARLLTEKKNLILAAREVLKMGPKFVVIKKGEHGSLMCTAEETFVLPAYPSEHVIDPTGAGDSFAGGMMGYLATHESFSPANIKKALAFGTVVASYTISDFSLAGLQKATRQGIDARIAKLREAMNFQDLNAEIFMRLFVGMEFDEPFWQRLVDLQVELRKAAPYISYTRPDNLHLTLKFIGEFEEAKLPALCDSLKDILKVGEFPMTLTGFDFLPERGPIRIIGAAVNGGGKLEVLQRLIDVACARNGIPLDQRPYRPHITLARARHPLPRSAKTRLASCYIHTPVESSVMDFVLMESKLSKEGAGYTLLQHVCTS